MKLIFIAHDSDLTGASKSMLALIDGLKSSGFKILVFIPNFGDLENALNNIQIDFVITKHRTNTFQLDQANWSQLKKLKSLKFNIQKYFTNKLLAYKYKSIIADFAPDYIITNTSTTYFGYFLAKVTGINHIWHIREFGKLDHGFCHFKEKSFHKFLRKSKHVICISKSLESYYKNKCQLTNTTVVYNGIFKKKEIHQQISKLKPHNKIPVFIFVGQLTESKGIWTFVKTIELIKKEKFCKAYILGNGTEYENIRSYIQEKSLAQTIELLGYIKQPELYYQKSDCFIMASKSEAFGRTTIEAVINKCFVIANNAGATKEILEDQKEAFFFNGTENDLLKQINIFLSLSISQKNSLLDNAMGKVFKRFNVEEMVKKFEKIIQ